MRNILIDKVQHWTKKIAVFTMTGILATGLTACSQEPFTALQQANDKMDQVKSGHTTMKLQLDNVFDTSTASEEALKMINYMKSVTIESQLVFDEDKKQFINQVYANIGGLGMDVAVYKNQDQLYLKYPVMKKYMDLKQMGQQSKQTDAVMNFKLTQETIDGLKALWEGLATKDTVMKGEPAVVTIKDKQVKATMYQIDIKGDQLKSVMQESLKLIYADPNVKATIEQAQKTAKTKQQAYTLLPEDMDRMFATMTIDTVVLKDYIDADGYILQKNVEVAYSNSNAKVQPSKTHFMMQMTHSELNQPVTLDMPEITPDKVYTEEELNKDLPAVFKSIGQ